MKIYAIIPARSGSVGVKNKNIRPINGKPLMAYSIEFAKALGVDRVFCSTDSEEYAAIAKQFGAEVPFLRSDYAASSTAMEQDILVDLYQKFQEHNIEQPDILVWLRPTFVFRSLTDVQKCIDQLKNDPSLTSSRTVCESEGRLYLTKGDILVPSFDDNGKSMMRRQDFGDRYKVFSTDVFRSDQKNTTDDFLGRKVGAVVTNKLCGLDIDDEFDFQIVENVLKYNKELINEYIDASYFGN
ncbi:acylneuraminate cytidylyltransferase family protein [Flavobacterium wongokense]|uniref:acylneuraminate cytidylyltransferase family protein n=1 Tax=Flavobacterium wongokense TaxID=2910674 RepID=UPI001F28D4AD|nr:acylneuraminate cytidylyltransferase family protein [Flavobacterium sp. WG47]MCF6132714.1 acylneuraminate cytidylyltransferase family protein [Flavobacterium sp. WG47]